jgi:hypothetical protein
MSALLMAFVALLTVSCTPPLNPGALPVSPTETLPGQGISPSGTSVPTTSAGDPGDEDLERIFPTLPGGIERIEPTQGIPITGEVPADLLQMILEDLSGRLGIELQQTEVVQAEAVLWPDGSLGCPDPGEVYLQEPVNGFRIVLDVGGIPYDYRASEKGFFKLCEQTLPLVPQVSKDP